MGISEAAVFKRKPSCAACGCPLATKLRALSSQCGAVELGEEPRWNSIVDEETEEKIKQQINKQ